MTRYFIEPLTYSKIPAAMKAPERSAKEALFCNLKKFKESIKGYRINHLILPGTSIQRFDRPGNNDHESNIRLFDSARLTNFAEKFSGIKKSKLSEAQLL